MPFSPRPSRGRAALAFAFAGGLAGASHVLASDSGDVRLWREVVPLACVVGALLGALVRPIGWRRGALLAALAVPVFALAYGMAEATMMARRGETSGGVDWLLAAIDWAAVVLGRAAVGGCAAVFFGCVAGAWLKRTRPHE